MTLVLLAGILLAATVFCQLQTGIHFVQIRDKVKSGLKYDGAFKYSIFDKLLFTLLDKITVKFSQTMET